MFRSASPNTTSAKSGNSSLFQNDKSEEGFVQPKLTVGKPNDKYEVEADRVADQVVAKTSESNTPFFSPAPSVQRQSDEKEGDVQQKPIAETITPVVLRQPEEETAQKSTEIQNKADVSDGASVKPLDHSSTNFDTQKKEEEVQEKEEDEVSEVQPKMLQRKEVGVPTITNNIESRIQKASQNGKSMSKPVKSTMESGFGTNFSGVKVHTDSESSSLNKQMSSKAFTYKNNVFFGENQYQPETKEGKHLIAHELTHVVQQGHAQKGENAVETETVQPKVQRLGISDALDFFADAAHNIPGFRMFTIILGINPINMSSVDRSAANIMRAIVEFLPGGNLITRVLDKYNVFTDAAELMNQKIETLNLSGASIKRDIDNFLDGLGWSDIFNLSGVWRDAKDIVLRPINAVIELGKSALSFIWEIVRKAILTPLAVLAQNTDGYDLLKALIGEDPITKEAYPPTAENLIGGFMKFIGQEEIWTNIQQGNAIGQAWAWFQGAMAGIKGIMMSIPGTIVETITSLTWEDIIILPNAFIKVGSAFANIAASFLNWGLTTVIDLLKILFSVVAPGVLVYIEKAQGAFNQILENPIGFIGNLVNAAKLGFNNFAKNIGTHLKNSLLDWLLGSLAGANIYIPQALSFQEIIKFVLSVLGLTWENLRAKLVEQIGEPAVVALETGFELVQILVTEGPAAAWEKIMEHVSNLQQMIISEISQFVIVKVVQKAVTKLVTMLNPAGAVIQAIIAIYDTVTFLIEKLQKIARVAAAIIDSIAAIANGVITQAAAKVESTLAGMLTLAVNFLAKFTGLDKVSEKIIEIVQKIREPIDTAMTNVVTWVVTTAKNFLKRILGGGDEGENPEDNDGVVGDGEIGEQVTFSDGEEGHKLWVEDGGSPVLKVASANPKPVGDKLTEWQNSMDKIPEGKRAEVSQSIGSAQGLVTAINQLITTYQQQEATATPENDAPVEATDTSIENKQKELKVLLQKLFSEFKEENTLTVEVAENDKIKAPYKGSKKFRAVVKKVDDSNEDPEKNKVEHEFNWERLKERNQENTFPAFNEKWGSDIVADSGGSSEHSDYKPQNITYELDGNSFVLKYDYGPEGLGKDELETIEVKMGIDQVSKDTINHAVTGTNLGIKASGSRGRTDSAGRLMRDGVDTTDLPQMNSAHLIADWFQGSGYRQGLNLTLTSEEYNQQVMKGAEDNIHDQITAIQEDDRYKDLLVTFTLQVTAVYQVSGDDEVFKTLQNLKPEQNLADVHKALAGDQDPRRCKRVTYRVSSVKAGGVPVPSNINIPPLGPDTYL